MSDAEQPAQSLPKPKRILHATKVGPVDMLRGMRRCSNGETPSAVAKEMGISHQTLIRWWTEYSRDLPRLEEMLNEVNTGEAYFTAQELARHVFEYDRSLSRIQDFIGQEQLKLRKERQKWLANPILAKAAKVISALIASR